MTRDINEFRFTGTVEQFKRIETKTGTPMISFIVTCWREKIRAVAFKELAKQTELAPGDRVEVRGSIQSTSWTDQTGQQRSGWQVIAHEINGASEETMQGAPQVEKSDPLKQYAYQDGPF